MGGQICSPHPDPLAELRGTGRGGEGQGGRLGGFSGPRVAAALGSGARLRLSLGSGCSRGLAAGWGGGSWKRAPPSPPHLAQGSGMVRPETPLDLPGPRGGVLGCRAP